MLKRKLFASLSGNLEAEGTIGNSGFIRLFM
jgi:hypothetical protein